MQAVQALERLGGVADARSLLRLTSPRRVRRAVRAGRILRQARGRYTLPTAATGLVAARRLSGVLCLRSAAAHHGWALKQQPLEPEVAVPRNRKVTLERRTGVLLVWTDLAADDVHAGVTSPLRTVVDCARRLPFDEALAVADSALRSGLLAAEELCSVRVSGHGAAAVRRVLLAADGRAANPFESVLRALAIDTGLAVEPQAAVDLHTGEIHPDVVCREVRTALEADSWTHHATRGAHRRDCARYNLMVVHGWRVLRFTWEQVMHEQAYVRWVLAELQRSVGRAEGPEALPLPA